MRKNQYYENLIQTVIDASESNIWDTAVLEWEIVDCEIDESKSNSCVCGKDFLKYLFTIKNTKNGNELFPIGSTCINKFERDDLDYEVSVYQDMFELMSAVEKNEYIELGTKHFSRNLLRYLYEHDVFKPNEFNEYDGENDYSFMLKMFNKRNKVEILDVQKRKIRAIIIKEVIPFIKGKIKIRKADLSSKEVKKEICPNCGSVLVIRISKQGPNIGAKFYGCSNFPKCKYTRSLKND